MINVERPGISAYVTCGRDGTIKFWHKGTFAHFRTIRHLDAMKAAYEIIIMVSDFEHVSQILEDVSPSAVLDMSNTRSRAQEF